MIGDGEMTVDKVAVSGDPKPWFRWNYSTYKGGNYLGARLRKTKASALRDGRIWLEQQKNS